MLTLLHLVLAIAAAQMPIVPGVLNPQQGANAPVNAPATSPVIISAEQPVIIAAGKPVIVQ